MEVLRNITAILVLAFLGFFSGEEVWATNSIPPGGAIFHAKLSKQLPQDYQTASRSWIKALNKADITMPAGAEIQMQFAEIFAAPGDIREVHWHVNSGEWAYIKNGTCEFTLMDNEGRYDIDQAKAGDVWYFPKGWQHSFQAVDPVLGCSVLFWFDKSDVNIDITHTIGEIPIHILQRSLKDMPEETAQALRYPLYEPNDPSNPKRGVLEGEIQTNSPEDCKSSQQYPCKGSLEHRPVFPMKGGKRTVISGAGTEFKVRNTEFPATLTMSGGLLELQEGAIREVHWHPNAEEQHYVLTGKVQVTVFGVDQDSKDILKDTFILSEGDLGIVPVNFIHYIEAVDGPASVVVTFNSPSWRTQTLSQTLLTTPKHVTLSTLNTTESIFDNFFPQEFVEIIPPHNNQICGAS